MKYSSFLVAIAIFVGAEAIPTPDIVAFSCPDQGELQHGSISCTDGWNQKSTCTFSCDDPGFEVYPSNRLENTCGPDQQWDVSKPCCHRPCPPYAVMDVVIVLDSSSSIGITNWLIMTTFAEGIIRSFHLGSGFVNFAVFRYNSAIDTDTEIFLNDYPGNVQRLLEAVREIPYNGKGSNVGKGLRHALDVSLSVANGNRDDAKDIIILMTDGGADADPKTAADDLRQAGATILVLGFEPPIASLDANLLGEIAGEDENLILTHGGFGAQDKAIERLSKIACGELCK